MYTVSRLYVYCGNSGFAVGLHLGKTDAHLRTVAGIHGRSQINFFNMKCKKVTSFDTLQFAISTGQYREY
jgi:hypothetical protein